MIDLLLQDPLWIVLAAVAIGVHVAAFLGVRHLVRQDTARKDTAPREGGVPPDLGPDPR